MQESTPLARQEATVELGPDVLREGAPGRDEAIRQLWSLLRRAAGHHVHRMPEARAHLGAVRIEEIIEAAADMATIDVLAKLDAFEGRSRFTTWAFKFGINHAATEARRAIWRDRDVALDGHPEPTNDHPLTPASHVEGQHLADAVAQAMNRVLTSHQRHVAVAVLIDEIPIDVLAERMTTNRNALYKTLHDARRKLRAELQRYGYITSGPNGAAK